ncbi:MAG: hypothetical protein LLG06_04140 [Desulfobacteraceae bacterium]|nr:hypothetical protein [Desulfobacteraceae bacterium]
MEGQSNAALSRSTRDSNSNVLRQIHAQDNLDPEAEKAALVKRIEELEIAVRFLIKRDKENAAWKRDKECTMEALIGHSTGDQRSRLHFQALLSRAYRGQL